MLPIVIVLICIGWRILKRRKQEEKDEEEFMNIKSRPIDPDESMKINSDDESIPYKKEAEDSPEPTDPVRIDSQNVTAYPYNQPYDSQLVNSELEQYPPPPPPLDELDSQTSNVQSRAAQPSQSQRWDGETEIN